MQGAVWRAIVVVSVSVGTGSSTSLRVVLLLLLIRLVVDVEIRQQVQRMWMCEVGGVVVVVVEFPKGAGVCGLMRPGSRCETCSHTISIEHIGFAPGFALFPWVPEFPCTFQTLVDAKQHRNMHNRRIIR